MGECNYYLKARFATADDAKAALPRLVALLTEGEQAYGYWQDARTREDRVPRTSLPTAGEFWAEFRERFPLVRAYLGELDGVTDWDDGLVGQLGSLVAPQPDALGDPSASLVCREAVLYLRLNGIWHFSDLRLLEEFCEADLGAVAVGSVSEEDFDRDEDEPEDPDFDPFDFIDA